MEKRRRITRLLGIGFDAEDGHVRITKGEGHDVLMGSEESHEYLQQLIKRIEDALQAQGITLDDIDPEEFGDFVSSIK